MRRALILVMLLAFSSENALALDCEGNITQVMDHFVNCSGNMAYMTDNSNGKWFCTISATSTSIVLAAFIAGKKVSTRILPTSDPSCSQISTHYQTPQYIVMKN